MTSTRSALSFVRSLSIALLAMLILFPFFTGVSAQPIDLDRHGISNQQGDQQPLDLPAMALQPADFTAEGRDEYGQSFGYLADRPRKIATFIESLELDAGNPDGAILAGVGPERSYALQLGRLQQPASDLALYSQAAFSFILEFDDDDAAGDALDEMEDAWLDAGYLDTVSQAERVGDESFYLEGDAINVNSGQPDERTMLIFQVENLVAGIVIINSTDDDPPTQELTENLALRLADRVESVIDGDVGGSLAHMVLRLRIDGDDAQTDAYRAFNGEWICSDLEVVDFGGCDERRADVDEQQTGDFYTVEQRVAGDWEQGTPESIYWVFLRNFSSVEAAEADFQRLLADRPETIVSTDLGLGDESYHRQNPSQGWHRITLLIRVGDMIVTVGHMTEASMAAEQGWTFEPSESATLELAERQVACMEGTESCAKPVRIPKEMFPAELEDVSSVAGDAIFDAIPLRRAA